ncbi:aminotransferase class I/II-fold pyridoxal phosphate-dependent enzyme [Limibacillus halophilus]|uniref:Arginine decarboxylase n=1 Tax=Limibacillus halophilus TaxID=1579333 RepID=A0A839SSD4_9PROT|nr:aminotransferase class I/II-fold pyridoxal phosphate-dependent enzyme [Limibacillus halophilus]MBB3065228.1 arginine decarboxylase [Limibacillus halophilus]
MSNELTSGSGPALNEYYNASQLRADSWSRLKADSARLAAAAASADTSSLQRRVAETMAMLEPIEIYWAFPGRHNFKHLQRLFELGEYVGMSRSIARIVRSLMSNAYRHKAIPLGLNGETEEQEDADSVIESAEEVAHQRPYFEILVVDNMTLGQEQALRHSLRKMRRSEDQFIYEAVIVPSFEDAVIAVLQNHNIQAVVARYGFSYRSVHNFALLHRSLTRIDERHIADLQSEDYGIALARVCETLRPELDFYLVTDQSVEDVAGRVPQNCRRVFYNQEDYVELHLNILRGINKRYKSPFFSALREYARQPTGVFHAMPISRGKSITKSHWIKDMGEFYGLNIFLAETSATSGGLDSLLDPHGPIKEAQELAARAFGAKQTYFVTNGTSTANKIVVQSLIRPGDIVLVDRDCHKSHHYGMVLSGAQVIYLDSYPLDQFSMYGAVPLREIKHQLLKLKKAGKLDRVKLLLLTNCTFDGIVYNVERFMQECLAIKPDLVFLWDEAWFAFARFGPTYRQRTAMHCAKALRERYCSDDYRETYVAWKEEFDKLDPEDEATWLDRPLLPDPDQVVIRTYACQSTHKTLTSLRQGSMIHVYDQSFRTKVEDAFHEAYMTHTSTSPNYQILASLDVGRRQVELEGFELVQKQVEMAMVLRQAVASHPLLRKHFRFLTVQDMIPEEYRKSGIKKYYDPEDGWTRIWEAWAEDEFVLDATRLTLYVGDIGIDGDTFKNRYLMEKYGIQVNKTSRNTVLFMTNIGTTRSSVAYLIEVLVSIAHELEEEFADANQAEQRVHARKVHSLTKELPPLPDFSRFHGTFQPGGDDSTGEGDLRTAYFLAYDDSKCDFLPIEDDTIEKKLKAGEDVVSAMFVIPYPPGFPILVPGQVVSPEILEFMRKLDVKEIHGYRPEIGLRVFTREALSEEAQKN